MCVCVCVCMCVSVKITFFVIGPGEKKSRYFKINRSTKKFFKRIIYFALTYVYDSNLLLSSQNISRTRLYEWGTQ